MNIPAILIAAVAFAMGWFRRRQRKNSGVEGGDDNIFFRIFGNETFVFWVIALGALYYGLAY